MPMIHEGGRAYEATEEEWHEHQRLLLLNAMNRVSDEELGRIALTAILGAAGWSPNSMAGLNTPEHLQKAGAAIRAELAKR